MLKIFLGATKLEFRNMLSHSDFIEKELEPFAITQRKKYLETDYQEPWMKTSGLMDLFKKKGLR